MIDGSLVGDRVGQPEGSTLGSNNAASEGAPEKLGFMDGTPAGFPVGMLDGPTLDLPAVGLALGSSVVVEGLPVLE